MNIKYEYNKQYERGRNERVLPVIFSEDEAGCIFYVSGEIIWFIMFSVLLCVCDGCYLRALHSNTHENTFLASTRSK